MNTLKTGLLLAAALAVAIGPASAVTAAGLDYKCASSTREIDDTSYDGPWPDNWKVTMRTCAAR
ncbi:hypothetical protein [Streptomyces virginiae]|uniref:hypothetical protein n=1 Tax=Streptomyces virginiae TaxID=1961 RepID=UPI003435B120